MVSLYSTIKMMHGPINIKYFLRFTQYHQKCNSLCSQSFVRHKSWCTGLAILLILQLQPWPRDHLYGLRFSFDLQLLLFALYVSRFACLPLYITSRNEKNISWKFHICRTLLKSLNIPILVKIGQHEHKAYVPFSGLPESTSPTDHWIRVNKEHQKGFTKLLAKILFKLYFWYNFL